MSPARRAGSGVSGTGVLQSGVGRSCEGKGPWRREEPGTFGGHFPAGCGRLCPWVRVFKMLLTMSVAAARAWLGREGRESALLCKTGCRAREEAGQTAPARGGGCQGAAGTVPGKHTGLLGDGEPSEVGARRWHRAVWEVQVRGPTGDSGCAGAGALHLPLGRAGGWSGRGSPGLGRCAQGLGGEGSREMGASSGCV